MGSLSSREILCPGTKGMGTVMRMPFSLRSAQRPGMILVVPFQRAITKMGISAGNLTKARASTVRGADVSESFAIQSPRGRLTQADNSLIDTPLPHWAENHVNQCNYIAIVRCHPTMGNFNDCTIFGSACD